MYTCTVAAAGTGDQASCAAYGLGVVAVKVLAALAGLDLAVTAR